MRARKEIVAETKLLSEMRDKVRPYSIFGDDNRAAIDAQIQVFETDLDEDEIYQLEDEEEFTSYQKDAALDALQWSNGDSDDKPSDSWAPLVQT